MLVTHRGLSGPAILQASSYWRPGEAIAVDLAPDLEVLAPLLPAMHDAMSLRQRSHCALCSGAHGRAMDHVSPARRLDQRLPGSHGEQLHAWRITPDGTEGYAKAEVTAGGVDTAELDAKTMQSRRSRTLLHRRSRRRNRMARRLQLPVGVGLGASAGRAV